VAKDLLFGRTPRDWSCGSIVLPKAQERRILDKVDDVRRDVRRAGSRAMVGLLCLSAAAGLAAVSSIYRSSKEKRP
jgi:hypothetical protein